MWQRRQRSRRRDQKWELKNGVYQPVLLERHIEREIITRLWLQARIKVWKINQPVAGKTAQNEPGIPDLMGWLPFAPNEGMRGVPQGNRPLPLYIEVKRLGGVRRPAQERFIQEARAGGCAAFFAYSWADVVRELEKFGVSLREV